MTDDHEKRITILEVKQDNTDKMLDKMDKKLDHICDKIDRKFLHVDKKIDHKFNAMGDAILASKMEAGANGDKKWLKQFFMKWGPLGVLSFCALIYILWYTGVAF